MIKHTKNMQQDNTSTNSLLKKTDENFLSVCQKGRKLDLNLQQRLVVLMRTSCLFISTNFSSLLSRIPVLYILRCLFISTSIYERSHSSRHHSFIYMTAGSLVLKEEGQVTQHNMKESLTARMRLRKLISNNFMKM